jgi:hypothetical protein
MLGAALPQAALLADAALLASLTVWESELVQEAMANHPAASPANTIAAAGGRNVMGAGNRVQGTLYGH